MAANIMKGDDLMLFDAEGHSIAYATQHTLTITADAADISSKDHGFWGGSEVNKISWEITSENLYTTAAYDSLFTQMIAKQPITVFFGLKTETGDGTVVDGDYDFGLRKQILPILVKCLLLHLLQMQIVVKTLLSRLHLPELERLLKIQRHNSIT